MRNSSAISVVIYPVESFEVGDLLCTSWVNVGVRSVIVLCVAIYNFGVVVCWCELACIYTTSSYGEVMIT